MTQQAYTEAVKRKKNFVLCILFCFQLPKQNIILHQTIQFQIFVSIILFFVYVWGPERKEIIIYPSPEVINKVLFQDNANNCFKLEQKEVKCPTDPSLISQIPIQ